MLLLGIDRPLRLTLYNTKRNHSYSTANSFPADYHINTAIRLDSCVDIIA